MYVLIPSAHWGCTATCTNCVGRGAHSYQGKQLGMLKLEKGGLEARCEVLAVGKADGNGLTTGAGLG